jgi:ketosteroid isomerase-like protein
MKRIFSASCAIGLIVLLGGCSDTPAPPADTSAADQKSIKDGEIAWSADFGAKDVDKLVSHYAEDASLFIPDFPVMKGKDAIRTGIKAMMADKNLSLSFTTGSVEVSKGGDLAYSQGSYAETSTDPKTKKAISEKGKYVTVYKKQADGSWKAVADIVNADAPATPVVSAKARAKKSVPAAKKKKKK